MFPGQGSQTVGMGCDLCSADPLMRQTYAEASAVLGYDLEELCADGTQELLARTDVTQPALLADSVAIFRLLRREGLRFDVAVGHSLGEYTALVATGAVSFADALRLVRRRGEEMLAPPRPTPAAWPPCWASTTIRQNGCAPAWPTCGRRTSTARGRSW